MSFSMFQPTIDRKMQISTTTLNYVDEWCRFSYSKVIWDMHMSVRYLDGTQQGGFKDWLFWKFTSFVEKLVEEVQLFSFI